MDGQAIKAALGRNIKFLRFRRKFSQAVLAEKADISTIFLSNIERGNKFPKPDTLARIATALDVEVYELFKTDLLPEDNKEPINRLSEDIIKNVNLAIAEVFKWYLR
ncbi:MAG: helix-turn-helix domain-containing protein [Treponema sp.]|jgi:transcriptional regulator with XRE-family HTH domain|nr:helix-turn-helix domain-containing protein [Treponema sp.]